EERQKVADELLQLKDEVERISSSIEFNGKKLLDGSSTEIRLQFAPTCNLISVELPSSNFLPLNSIELDILSTSSFNCNNSSATF
ncbi:flagellin N-terminal helical domain-containing protein, partial [Clostridioides difficile]